ncbi:MAG: geranylgeranylglycerol-phosphate geranylgeranyltransferase [Cytophagaceae bacterium]|jgi:4-hydroxybenzoate polyprenyltransferase|nr:geranylgeranylglycerol-phosphate geranylgeranyltransferase [Cytophagaceae bacterium]
MIAFFKLVRIKNLIVIALLQYLLRYGLLVPMLEFYGLEPVLSHLRFGLLALATVLLAASGNVINDYFDVKTDRINRPRKVIVGNIFHRRTVLLMHVLLTLTAVFIGLFLSYIYRKENYALVFILIPILLWYYSTTWKKQILIGNMVISLLTALVPYFVVSIEFAALVTVHGRTIVDTDACSMAWFWTTGFAFFAFISTLGREIIKDMEDEKGDREAGCHTLPIEMGIGYTKTVVIVLTLISVITLWTLYFTVLQLKSDILTPIYLILLFTIPYLLLALKVHKAKTARDFHWVSQISKLIMLFGILFTLVARTFFS